MPALIPVIVAAAATWGASAAIAAYGGALLVGATGLTFAGTLLAGLIGTVVAAGTSMLLGGMLGTAKAKGAAQATAEDRKQMIRQAVAPRQIIYGQAKVGGVLVYASSAGADQRFLHLVSVLAAHPCDAVPCVWVNGTSIFDTELDGAGMVVNGANPLVGKCRIKVHLGTQTTADADLVAESPDGWGADHKLLGCTYVYVRLEYDRDRFAGGLQNIAALVRGKSDIWDPRTDTTGYTNNWALCVLDYVRGSHGVAAPDWAIHEASFVAAANLSDEAVPLDAEASTTQPRYTCDIVVTRDLGRRAILARMTSAGAGVLVRCQGQYRLHGGAYTAPIGTLTASDLAGNIRITTKAPLRDVFNAVKGTFISPDHYWQQTEFPALTEGAYEVEDGGRVWRDLELPATIDPVRAQRLGLIELRRGREYLTIEAPVRYAALRWGIWDSLSVTVPQLGISAKPMRITRYTFDPVSGAVSLILREESAFAFAWIWEAANALPPPPDSSLISPLDIPVPTSLVITATTSLQSDGAVVPALAVTWTASAHAFVQSHEVQWRVSAGPGAWSAAEVPAGTDRYIIAPVRTGELMDVRVRAVAGLVRSPWTSVIQESGAPDTTAPGAPTGLTGTGITRGASWSWTNPSDADLERVEIQEYFSGAWAKVGEARSDFFVSSGWEPGESRVARVRAIDRTGNIGAWSDTSAAAIATRAVTNDLASGSVSIGDADDWDGPSSPTDYTTLLTLTVGDASFGGRIVLTVVLHGTAEPELTGSGGEDGYSLVGHWFDLRVKQGGTMIWEARSATSGTLVYMDSIAVTAGSYVFDVEARVSDTVATLDRAAISATLLMR